MEPKSKDTRKIYGIDKEVSVASVNDNEENFDIQLEDGKMSFLSDDQEDSKFSDEDIKIKALNQAINIAKLMSDITVEDVLEIADKVAKYIKG